MTFAIDNSGGLIDREQHRGAVLDSEHVGDIRGALGTVRLDDVATRRGRSAQLKTLLAIIGPGLIVMIGDNDAGAFATYGQAGQNYGTHLLWTLLLLVPVLYVNQEMVLRLGAVTGVGHARLIMERFGKFWGAFSVIDLFLLNALTIVTEFIGITLAAGYLGLPKALSVVLAALVVVGSAFTGSFRRFERMAMLFCAGSLLLIPLYFLAHPRVSQMAHDFVVPQLPGGSGQLATVMLLVIGIVGTTVAPWQLFFQQSYVIDKRITPRFMRYEKTDLWIGIVIVVIGAAAIMGATTAAFAGTHGFGQFSNAAGLANGVQHYAGKAAGVIFAVALLDASIIGAFAVSLSTAYAIGDVFGLKHSLHRGVKGAKGFYAVYAGTIAAAATIVLIPGSPLGLLTEGVQTLAGVLLPSATVFLLLLCNDREVLGPWVNGRKTNLFAGAVVGVLISLSVILTASVLFPRISSRQIIEIMIGCAGGMVLAGVYLAGRRLLQGTSAAVGTAPAVAGAAAGGPAGGSRSAGGAGRTAAAPGMRAASGAAGAAARATADTAARDSWRMPPLALLKRPVMSTGRKIGMSAMWLYLAVAIVLLVLKVVELAIGH
jgi:Mn2+/Fe2+ NRAMP family transporter